MTLKKAKKLVNIGYLQAGIEFDDDHQLYLFTDPSSRGAYPQIGLVGLYDNNSVLQAYFHSASNYYKSSGFFSKGKIKQEDLARYCTDAQKIGEEVSLENALKTGLVKTQTEWDNSFMFFWTIAVAPINGLAELRTGKAEEITKPNMFKDMYNLDPNTIIYSSPSK